MVKLKGVLLTEGMHGMISQAEDGIRDPIGSRGLGDVYKRQLLG